jgi:hypothetical protein
MAIQDGHLRAIDPAEADGAYIEESVR